VLDKIGVSAWTFNREFKSGQMEHPQFFEAVRSFGITSVELNSPFFKSMEAEYLLGIRDAADSNGINIVNIAIDDWSYDLSSPDDARRLPGIDKTISWFDAAVVLGCPNVRNNTGGEDFESCVASFTTLAGEAAKRNVTMLIEAHGGFSSDAAYLVPLADRVNAVHPGALGLIPDFGNVHVTPERDRLAQITEMAKYARLVHPKMHDFDADGNQPEWDTPGLVSAVRSQGFDGIWIIEFEGHADTPTSGLTKSIALLTRSLGY
jgi:sugar phosphate isomerase/epimerase